MLRWGATGGGGGHATSETSPPLVSTSLVSTMCRRSVEATRVATGYNFRRLLYKIRFAYGKEKHLGAAKSVRIISNEHNIF